MHKHFTHLYKNEYLLKHNINQMYMIYIFIYEMFIKLFVKLYTFDAINYLQN